MRRMLGVVLLMGLALSGCLPPEQFESAAPATLSEIDPIRDNEDLTPQQMRSQLEELGLSPPTINALLKDERLGNQFGGDLRTAYTKVTAPSFTKLTPDEIQVYGDEASSVDEELNVSLTDEEAQAIVTLFQANDLSSPEKLEAFLNNPSNTVPSEIPDGVLSALFLDFDAALLLPRLP